MNKKVNIITGAPLSGKGTYIKANFQDLEKYYHLDFSKTCLELFGNCEKEEERASQIYNKMTEDLFDYVYFGTREIVFEFCTGIEGSNKELKDLIELIKSKGMDINLIHLDCSEKEVLKRNETVKQDPKYYSSYYLNEDMIAILSNFIEDVAMNSLLETE